MDYGMQKEILPVLLPERNLIEPRELVKAIANALYPTDPLCLKGIRCIVGKSSVTKVKVDVESLDYYNECGCDANENCEHYISLPYLMSEADIQSLRDILSQLPELKYPVDEKVRDEVLNALENHPLWDIFTPIFIDEAEIERIKIKHKECEQEHLNGLVLAVKEKRITCCNANHVPMTSIGIGAFIPRQAAQIYLESIGLLTCGDESDISNTKKSNSYSNLFEMAGRINWKEEKFVSDKLKALCAASELWLQKPYDENLDKIDYRYFHENEVSPLLMRPAFKGRANLQHHAAEYIRPLYARRMMYKEIQDGWIYKETRTPELTALLLASRLWDGWKKKGETTPPTKSAIADAIKQALPEGFQVSTGFLKEGPKIIQPEAADTGREMQLKANRVGKLGRRA
jgi:hypothetical protein